MITHLGSLAPLRSQILIFFLLICLLLCINSSRWNIISPVLHAFTFCSFTLFVQPSMNHVTALKFLIALVPPLQPFPSLSSNTVSDLSSVPRKELVNQRHHVRRRLFKKWSKSFSWWCSWCGPAIAKKQAHNFQWCFIPYWTWTLASIIQPTWQSTVARTTDEYNFSTSHIGKLPCSEHP